jgi:GNAT superfamily N-acetyltransferase
MTLNRKGTESSSVDDDLSISEFQEHEIDKVLSPREMSDLMGVPADATADIAYVPNTVGSAVLAGRNRGRVVAIAMVSSDGRRGWVHYLRVERIFRGRGYRDLMVRACEEWAEKRGVSKMSVMLQADDKALVSLYESLGYSASEHTVLSRWIGRK